MTSRIGRYVTSHPTFVADMSSGTQRAYVADQSSTALIVYRLGAYAGYKVGGSTAHLRLGLGSTSGTNPDPASLLAYTNDIPLTVAMDESSGGTVVTSDLATPVLCNPGIYALVGATTGDAWLAELAASEISSRNEQFYTKTGLSSNIPTNPIGGSPAIEGQLAIWAEGDANVPPNTPTALSPSGVITGGNFTPVMWGTFVDGNQMLSNGAAWDYIAASQIQVIRQSDSHVMWDHTEASGPTQQSESKTQITYNGQTLAANVTYTYNLRQQDRAGAWSHWASTTFSIAPAGSVATPAAPSGKQTTLEPGPFTAVWTHQTALSTNAVQVQLFLDGQPLTTPFALSPVISQTVANNGTISVTWAATTFADLQWGQKYWAQLRGRDTNNVWSSWSSPAVAFWPDAAPSVPSQLSPANSAVTTTLPLLVCVATDADNDHTSGLVVKARIKNSGGTVLVTDSMTYNSTLSRWEYQTTATDLASYATYKWDAYSGDGVLWSGAQTVEANATKSAEATFVYAQGPVLSALNPADGGSIAVARPTISWTVSNQASVRLQIWQDNADGTTGPLIYDTGVWSQTTTNWPLTPVAGPGGTVYSGTLRNGNTYEYVLTVVDTNGLTGVSAPTHFTVALTPPDTITGFTAVPVRLGTDIIETGILLTWDASAAPGSTFEGYEVWRTALGPDGVTPVGTPLLLRNISSPLQTAYLDGEPAAGISYQYELIQVVRNALDDLASAPATQVAGVAFDGVILSWVIDPETYHVDLRYSANDDEGTLDFAQDLQVLQPFGATLGQAVRGAYQAWSPSGLFSLINDTAATAQGRWDALKAIAGLGGTLCYRDGRGEVRYVVMTKCSVTYRRILRYDVQLAFTEIAWTPGQAQAVTAS